jgi:hypothetical protein
MEAMLKSHGETRITGSPPLSRALVRVNDGNIVPDPDK